MSAQSAPRFVLHLASHARRFPHPLPVLQFGRYPTKAHWIDWKFEFIAFSIVLAGSGRLFVDGQSFEVRAPTVICEYPGPHFFYGPHRTWDEVFINYDRSLAGVLKDVGLLRPGRFVWPISAVSRIKRMTAELEDLAFHFENPGTLERIDRLSEWIVTETLLEERERSLDVTHEQLLKIRAFLEAHCDEPIDFEKLARKHGLSFTTFRRHWRRHMQQSPAQFVQTERMKQACRLLCETQLSIAQIADRLGFVDPLYFSRAFHRRMGEPASEYRRRHGVELAKR